MRSERRALIINRGIFRFFAWLKCSGHSSLSTRIAISGSIVLQTFREKEASPKERDHVQALDDRIFGKPFFKPVLVVPLKTTSMDGLESKKSSNLASEEVLPHLLPGSRFV